MPPPTPDGLAFHPQDNDPRLIEARVDTPACTGTAHTLGATVTGWTPRGQAHPVLYLSPQAVFREGKAARGGVPLCFPWFGPHPDDAGAPAHGLVRTRPWTLGPAQRSGDTVGLSFTTATDAFAVACHASLGPRLEVRLEVTNTTDTPQCYEAALHTYLAVGDAEAVSIAGLEGTDYLDKTDGGRRKRQADTPVVFTGETDRVYLDTRRDCTLTDPVWRRRVTVAKSGADATVVWNPWAAKAAALSDLPDDGWRAMCCIEAASIGDHAVTLAPGARRVTSTTVSVEAF